MVSADGARAAGVSKTPHARRLGFLATALFLMFGGSASGAEPQRFTIDALLQAEDFGDAVFSPDGKGIAFEQVVARADLESTIIESDGLDDQRVFVADLQSCDIREIGGEPGEHFALAAYEPWAPGGKMLALSRVAAGEIGLAVWSADTGKITRLSGRPPSFYPQQLWLADGKVAHLSLPDNVPQRYSHSQTLGHAAEIWRGVWRGASNVVSVSSANLIFPSSQQAPPSLLVTDLSTDHSEEIGKGDYREFWIAPGHTRLAAIRLAEPATQALSASGRRGELEIFEVTPEGVVRTNSFPSIDVSAVSWSPQGDRLLVAARTTDALRSETTLYIVDLATGRQHRIRPTDLSFLDPTPYSGWAAGVLPIGWINGYPAAVAASRGSRDDTATQEGGRSSSYGQIQGVGLDVYVFQGDSAEKLTGFASTNVTNFMTPAGFDGAMVITDGALWRVRQGKPAERLSPEGLSVVGLAVDRRYPAPPDTSAYHKASDGTESVALTALSKDRESTRRVILRLENRTVIEADAEGQILASSPNLTTSASVSADGWLKRLTLIRRGGARTLAVVNSDLKDIAAAPIRRISYRAGDETLTGWVILPTGTAAGQRLPAIVWVYGGAVWNDIPTDAQPSASPPAFNGQLLAAAGFAVIYPSMPVGRGADTDIPKTLADQAIAAVDAAAAAGLVDPAQVGVIGQSFGGYSTAAILAERSDRFRAGVALAGSFDWIANYGVRGLEDILAGESDEATISMTFIEEGQPGLGEPFWKDPQSYIRNSPIFEIEKLDAPLLILHGDMDIGPTSFVGAARMYAALVRAGKKPTLVRYWGEGHVARSEAGVRDQWYRISEWFKAHLDTSDRLQPHQ